MDLTSREIKQILSLKFNQRIQRHFNKHMNFTDKKEGKGKRKKMIQTHKFQ